MSRVIHVGTVIQTTFAVLDDEQNAIQQEPITCQVGKFHAEAFAEAFTLIAKDRDRAAKQLTQPAPRKPPSRRTRPKR